MKILLDECIPRKFKNALPDHDCQTVPEAGLSGEKNRLLLALAERAGFDLFFTMDKGIQYQQDLAGRRIAILIVRAKSNRLVDLLTYLEACRLIMDSIQPGEVRQVGDPATIRKLLEGPILATSDDLPGLVARGRSVAEVREIALDVARNLIEARREREGTPKLPPTSCR